MSDQDEDFAALLDASFAETGASRGKRVRPGQLLEGKVIEIGRDTIFVDVGTRSEGQIAKTQLQDDTGKVRVEVGDIVRATVTKGGDRPTLVISFAGGAGNIENLQLAREAGTPVEGRVEKAIKGGLLVQIGEVSAFCPASQFDIAYTADLSVFEGQDHSFKVIDVRDRGRTVVVSRRAILEAERAEQSREVLARLAVGDEIEGAVASTQSYGAFIDIGGIQGLAHISELGHGHVERVEDLFSVGERVKVRVLAIDTASEGASKEKPRIKLSIKATLPPPEGPLPGEAVRVLDGEVTKVEPFGVFVSCEIGTGLVPTREVGLPPGGDPRRAFPVGKKVQVVRLAGDNDGKLRLSIKAVGDAEERSAFQAFNTTGGAPANRGRGSLGSFGSLLAESLGSLTLAEGPVGATPASMNRASKDRPAATGTGTGGKRRRVL
ncbi:MAG: S1 RNA-binding domain-containing protein [Nannocystaceae bacterium]